MSTKVRVWHYLSETQDQHTSGQKIANDLHLSRNAVWKAIKRLQQEGHLIEAIPNKGYRLLHTNPHLNESALKYLINIPETDYHLAHFHSIDSTNNVAKLEAERLTKPLAFYVAEEQTAGRGRYGRTFYSPKNNGLYVTYLTKADRSLSHAGLLTTAAAVAVCEVIETLYQRQPQIKWINDLFFNGKKICGILTEGVINMESGLLDYAIVGIGINLFPDAHLPEDLQPIVGSLFEHPVALDRNVLAATLINQLHLRLHETNPGTHLDAYRERCFILNQRVHITQGIQHYEALATAINDDAHLVVQMDDGTTQTWSHGEIRIQLS